MPLTPRRHSSIRALDTARNLLVVSRFNDLLFFDVNTGEAAPGVYPFDFGSRLANGEPERVVRGLGYDGFADRLVMFYTDNPYGDMLQHKVMLAVFEGGGRHLRDIDTGVVIPAYRKSYPVVARYTNFTAEGHVRTDLGTGEMLDMKY